MLGEVMSSRSGEMYKAMVLDREHATSASGSGLELHVRRLVPILGLRQGGRGQQVVLFREIERELW